MSKLIVRKFEHTNKDGKTTTGEILCVKVASVEVKQTSTGKTIAVVKGSNNVWNAETKAEEKKDIEITFWKSETSNYDVTNALSKCKEGSTIIVRAKDNGDGKYTGYSFMWDGIMPYHYNGKDRELDEVVEREGTIIAGMAAKLYPSEDKSRISVSVPVRKWNAELRENETEWISVTFFNNEHNPNMVERIEKCMTPRDNESKCIAVFACSNKTEYTKKDGSVAVSYIGNNFDIIRYTKGKAPADAPASASGTTPATPAATSMPEPEIDLEEDLEEDVLDIDLADLV